MGTEPTRLEPTFVEIPPAIATEETPLEGEILGPDHYVGPEELVDLRFLDGLALAGEEEVAPPIPTAATATAYPLVDFKTNEILGFPTDEEANKGFKIMGEEPKSVATDFAQTDLVQPLNVMATYLATPEIFVPGNKIDIAGKAYDITPSTQNVTLYTGEVLPCDVLTLTHPESATAYVLLVGPKTAPNETGPFTRKVICLEVDRSGRKPKVTAAVDYEERHNDPEGISHALILSGGSSRYKERPASRVLYVRQDLTIYPYTWFDVRDGLTKTEQGCLDVLLSWRDPQNAELFKKANTQATEIYILDEKYTVTLEKKLNLVGGVDIEIYQIVGDNKTYRLIYEKDQNRKNEIIDCVAVEPGSNEEIGGLRHSITHETIVPITTPSALWDILVAWENIIAPERATILTVGGNKYIVSNENPVEEHDDLASEVVTTTVYRMTLMTKVEQKQSYQFTHTQRVHDDADSIPRHIIECIALKSTGESAGGLAYSTQNTLVEIIPSVTVPESDKTPKLTLDQNLNSVQFWTSDDEAESGWRNIQKDMDEGSQVRASILTAPLKHPEKFSEEAFRSYGSEAISLSVGDLNLELKTHGVLQESERTFDVVLNGQKYTLTFTQNYEGRRLVSEAITCTQLNNETGAIKMAVTYRREFPSGDRKFTYFSQETQGLIQVPVQLRSSDKFMIEKTGKQQGQAHWVTYAFPETSTSSVDSTTGFYHTREGDPPPYGINALRFDTKEQEDPQPDLVRGWRQRGSQNKDLPQGPFLEDYNLYLTAEDVIARAQPASPRIKATRTASNNWGVFGIIGFGGGNSQFTHAQDNDTNGLTETVDVGLSRDFNHVGGSLFGFRAKLDLNFTGNQHGVDGETETRQSPGFNTWSSTQLLGAEALIDLWDVPLGIGGLAGVREYFFTADDSMVLAGTDTVALDYVRFMPHPVVGGELFFYAPESWMVPENVSLYVGGRVMHSWQGDAIGQVRDHTVDGIENNIVRTDLTGKVGFEYKF